MKETDARLTETEEEEDRQYSQRHDKNKSIYDQRRKWVQVGKIPPRMPVPCPVRVRE